MKPRSTNDVLLAASPDDSLIEGLKLKERQKQFPPPGASRKLHNKPLKLINKLIATRRHVGVVVKYKKSENFFLS